LRSADLVEAEIRVALGRHEGARPLVVGLCGAQGSGKSTLAAALAQRIAQTAALSLDDLYKTRAAREKLAFDVHPLLRTRGAPGTHDVALGIAAIDALGGDRPTALPRFDKARDDRMPVADWPMAPAGTRLLIIEGWCVGARPQTESALVDPVNGLERDEDAEGVWRRHVNTALTADYQSLFRRIDHLILLAAPSFSTILGWRIEQERSLRAARGTDAPGVMTDQQLGRFVAHYERLTRHILAEMPQRADLTLHLDRDRSAIMVQNGRPDTKR
jgi:D-glycerate 3-kinase